MLPPADVLVADALEIELEGMTQIEGGCARILEDRLAMAVDGTDGYDLDDL